MKSPKAPPPAPPPLELPKPTTDSIREKKKTELMRLQQGSGRGSTIFTNSNAMTSQKTGG